MNDELLIRTFQDSKTRLTQVAAAYVSSGDAEDVVQEAFLRAWSHRDQFRQDSTGFTWVYRIAVNIAIDTVRRRRIVRKRLSAFTRSPNVDEFSLADMLAVRQALAALPADERELCHLRYGWGYSLLEISSVVGMSWYTQVTAIRDPAAAARSTRTSG